MTTRRSCLRPPLSPTNAEPNHFYKFILPKPIHGQKMRIPKEFIRRFGIDLSNEATITVPDNLVWKIGLKRFKDEVWFCNGWREFVKYYSVSHGFFLMFKYEGNSNFSVIILDMSATEIFYPCKNIESNNEEPNFEKQHSETEFSMKSFRLDDHPGYDTRSKRTKLEIQEEIINVEDVNALSRGNSGKNASDNPHKHSRKHGKDKSLSKKQRAIKAAEKFKPTNPFFTAIVRRSNLVRRYMDVPASFASTYLRKHDSMKLHDSNGQQWVTPCHIHGSSVRMIKGWIGFAKANNVREGDVCVFELIKRKNIVLKVTIFSSA